MRGGEGRNANGVWRTDGGCVRGGVRVWCCVRRAPGARGRGVCPLNPQGREQGFYTIYLRIAQGVEGSPLYTPMGTK